MEQEKGDGESLMKLDIGKFAGINLSEIPTEYLEVVTRNGEIARQELEGRGFNRLRSMIQRYPAMAYRLISGWQYKTKTGLTDEQKAELNTIIAASGIEQQPILTMNEEFIQFITNNTQRPTVQPLSLPPTNEENDNGIPIQVGNQ
jgi:hypothetical protein